LPKAEGPLRIAVLLGAEAYQAYHVADIAFELAGRDGVQVEIIALLPEALAQIGRLERGPADRLIPRWLLHTPTHLRLLQKARLLGSLKTRVMRDRRNVELLSGFDAIVTPTDHARVLRPLLNPRPAMIYVNHGIGGRAASYSDKYLGFDFILVAGANDERQLLDQRRIRPGHYAVTGYPKFEAAARLAGKAPKLFDNDRPTVLFNPHSKRALRSWEGFARPLIDHAAKTGEFNLIVAPHAKMFGRRPRSEWRRWERLAVPGRVIIDLGSERSLDMSYALAADIYAGDVSSQVYEFLAEPKPCIFVNAHGIEWRGNPDFPNWDLGDVVETPAAAIDAIRNAVARHPLYADRQRERMAAVVDRAPGAAGRCADAILAFLGDRREKPAPKRVMMLISDLGTGGTARATLLVANGLAAQGMEVSLLVTQAGSLLTPQLDPRVKLVEVAARRGRGVAMLPAARQIAKWLRAERPDSLLSAGNHMHVAASIAHRLAGPGCGDLVLKLTNPVERPGGSSAGNRARKAWYRRAFARAARVLTITGAARDELASAFPETAAKNRVVDNPYITDRMLDAGAKPHQVATGRLVAIGRLVEQKNYPLLLRALAALPEGRDWALDVLGDGPLRADLQALAGQLGITGRVTFHGFVEDPLPFLARAHALVLSSSWEGQGAVLLEALACGCPVIATRSTEAVADALGDGRFGTLVPAGNAAALTGAIDRELQHRTTVSREARKWVKRYQIEAGIRSHIEALGLGSR
jgi:glycosyltransferase involved in cell wall biosynthesis